MKRRDLDDDNDADDDDAANASNCFQLFHEKSVHRTRPEIAVRVELGCLVFL